MWVCECLCECSACVWICWPFQVATQSELKCTGIELHSLKLVPVLKVPCTASEVGAGILHAHTYIHSFTQVVIWKAQETGYGSGSCWTTTVPRAFVKAREVSSSPSTLQSHVQMGTILQSLWDGVWLFGIHLFPRPILVFLSRKYYIQFWMQNSTLYDHLAYSNPKGEE